MDPSSILIALTGITGYFTVLMALKRFVDFETCVLCSSVTLTWITLLSLYLLGVFQDTVIIALLMGQTVVGIYYVLEDRLEERYHVFKLPYILTATAAVYTVLLPQIYREAFTLLLSVWLLFSGIYYYRENPLVEQKFEALVECCKNW